MKFPLVVHSVSEEAIEQEVTLANGKKLTGLVPGLVVELVSDDERNNQTFRFIPDDWDATRELFTVGQAVDLSLTKGK